MPEPPRRSASRDLSGVLDAVLAGIVVLDAAGGVELANSAACRILETSAEALRGAAVERVFGADHAAPRLARAVLETGRPAVENELRIERRFDEDLEIDAAASPLFAGGAAAPTGVVLALRDRTIERRLEALVSERERLAAFGQIAAGIAHEVKNPLGGIRGAAEIIGARAADAKTRDAADLVVREVDRIAALVDELMIFTQAETLRMAPLNIHRVLDDVLDLVALDPLGAEIRVERHFDPSIPELVGDAQRLAQVFLNLARNGLQAMEGRPGTLAMTTRVTLDHRLSTPRGGKLPTLQVTVADTGRGIPPEIRDRLATPFFTTRPDGTGLGLAVSRRWVALHGGALEIESGVDAGTAVRVTLPLRRPGSPG